MLYNDLVYPITAQVVFEGNTPEVLNFESVADWHAHMMRATCDEGIVPADENAEQRDMFNPFSILFNNERTGQCYVCITSVMHMPVPAKTMLQ